MYFANKNRKIDRVSGTTRLYRGLQLSTEEVKGYEKGKVISLTGYVSTSMSFEVAREFALSDIPEDKSPVIYDIRFTGDEGLFNMSDPRYTAFDEDEVLIQDGFEYKIEKVDKRFDFERLKDVITVTLLYPAYLN